MLVLKKTVLSNFVVCLGLMNADFWIKIVLCCFDIFKEINLNFNYLLDKRLLTWVLNNSEHLK